jgi:anti-anti-sigma regulatory factor
MVEIAPGWEFDVYRESDWLVVTFMNARPDATDSPLLAEGLWGLIEQHDVRRLALQLDRLQVLFTHLIGQLVMLHKRLCVQGGAMRLCGLSEHNQQVLRLSRLDDRFPPYGTREDALLDRRP